MPGDAIPSSTSEAEISASRTGVRGLLFAIGLAVLLSLASWMLLDRLGLADLRGDEVIWARTLEAMTPDNAWMGLWPTGKPADRPPLFLWLAYATRPLLSDPGTQIRLWAALFGIGTVLLTVLSGRRMFGRATGLLAGFVLLVQGSWIHDLGHGARSGVSDSLITFFLLAAVGAVWQGLESSAGRKAPWLVAGGALAAVGMLKPLLLLPTFGLLILFVLVFADRPIRLGSLSPLARTAATCAALLLPWNLAMASRFGFGKLVEQNYLGHISKRVVEGIPEHLEGPFFYLVEISRPPNIFLLYLPIMALAVVLALRDSDRRAWGLIAIFGLGWVGSFSLVASKRIWYVFPVYPLIALAIAAAIVRIGIMLGDRYRLIPRHLASRRSRASRRTRGSRRPRASRRIKAPRRTWASLRTWASRTAGTLLLLTAGSLLALRSQQLVDHRQRWFDMPWRVYQAVTLSDEAAKLVRYQFPIRRWPPSYDFYDRKMTQAHTVKGPRKLRRIVRGAAAAGTKLVVISPSEAPPWEDETLRLLEELEAQVTHRRGFRIVVVGTRLGKLLRRSSGRVVLPGDT